MKRVLLTISLALFVFTSQCPAQNIYDALRYSQLYYSGTARSLAIGNSGVAIGGDMGTLSVNPAATGPYRYTELVITPGVYTNLDKNTYLGSNNNDSRTRFILSNIGWVGSFNTGRKRGLLNFNIGITANQTNNFASRTSAEGVNAESSFLASIASNLTDSNFKGNNLTCDPLDDPSPYYYYPDLWYEIQAWNTGYTFDDGSRSFLLDAFDEEQMNYIGATENIGLLSDGTEYIYLGGPLKQKYNKETTGYMQDVIFNFSGNVSDKFFFGVNFTFQSIFYHVTSSYSETAEEPNNFYLGFMSFENIYDQTTSGYGFKMQAGVIYRPIAGLSIGASISTPTWMWLNDKYTIDTYADFTDCYADKYSPLGSSSYSITAPFRWNVGVGYTIGRIAVISADYEMANYSQIKMSSSSYSYKEENNMIKDRFSISNNLRVGAEIKVIPSISLRAGYNYYGTSGKSLNSSDIDKSLDSYYLTSARHYVSFGLGYASKGGFFVDAGCNFLCSKLDNSYSLFRDYVDIIAPPLKSQYQDWQLLLSLGFRF